MSVLAFIPARGGSKGIPRKNLRPFCGRPLVEWTIEAAMQAREIEEIAVSSEDQEILSLAESRGVRAWLRPLEYATDEAPIEDALLYHLANLPDLPDTVAILQPTSPLRRVSDIDRAIIHYHQAKADSLLSLVEVKPPFIWQRDRALGWQKPYSRRPNRQERPLQWEENGAIYLSNTRGLITFRDRLFGRIAVYSMEPWQRYEIDSPADWEVCEALMQAHVLKGAGV